MTDIREKSAEAGKDQCREKKKRERVLSSERKNGEGD